MLRMFIKKFFSSLYSIFTCSYRKNTKKRTKKKREKIQKTGGIKIESDISEISGSSDKSNHLTNSDSENDSDTIKKEAQKDNYSEAVLSFYSEQNLEKMDKRNLDSSNGFRSLKKKQPFDNRSDENDSSSVVSLDSPKQNAQARKIHFNKKSNYSMIVDDYKNRDREILIKMKKYLRKKKDNS